MKTVTKKQFNAWQRAFHAPLTGWGAISVNEAWNESQGLPAQDVRSCLAKLQRDTFGMSGERITFADVRKAKLA